MARQVRLQDIKELTTNTTLTFPGYNGALITNKGASGAVTITVPTATEALVGNWFEVFVTDDQSVTVATATTDTLIVDGDQAADSIAWSTSSHKMGNSARFICVNSSGGYRWACQLYPAATSTTLATQTIATA